MEKLLEEISFSAGAGNASNIQITASYVDGKLGALAVNEDLSRYVL
jgi:ATP-dependent HslUV protease ATP-binding subunit HslU